jgi:hypothetical protein
MPLRILAAAEVAAVLRQVRKAAVAAALVAEQAVVVMLVAEQAELLACQAVLEAVKVQLVAVEVEVLAVAVVPSKQLAKALFPLLAVVVVEEFSPVQVALEALALQAQ